MRGVAAVETGQGDCPLSCPHRFHNRKIKRLYLYITRYMPSKSDSRQRKVKESFRTLIERTGWIVAVAEEFAPRTGRRATRTWRPWRWNSRHTCRP